MPGAFVEGEWKTSSGSRPSDHPTRIVPKGPILDFNEPHGRERLSG